MFFLHLFIDEFEEGDFGSLVSLRSIKFPSLEGNSFCFVCFWMAGICCGIRKSETSEPEKVNSHRRGSEFRPMKLVADGEDVVNSTKNGRKRMKLEISSSLPNGVEKQSMDENRASKLGNQTLNMREAMRSLEVKDVRTRENAKFGATSVCGRRRDMEDSVSIHPSFCREGPQIMKDLHFYGVYDGHGCSHVALKCKSEMHRIVKEELERDNNGGQFWKEVMEKSFLRMDKDVQEWRINTSVSNCRCELRTPLCDAVGSTAVVSVVTPLKIIVSNCGDSRAVLCRNGVAIPLSSDHKPDRPDELKRIESAGGRVIYWEGARVLGVLAMSRAIGDNYLKPFVISEPEVTITDRTAEDECLILASDGLWDVVSNETACSVVRMVMNAHKQPSPAILSGKDGGTISSAGGMSSDKACLDASILLTKLAMARNSSDNVSVVVVDLRRDL